MFSQISEMTMVYKYNIYKKKYIYYFRYFVVILPLKLCLCRFAGQRLHCSILHGAKNKGSITPPGKEQRFNEIARQICFCSQPRRVMEPSIFALRSYGAFVLCPAELWSNATFAPQNHFYFRDIYNHCDLFLMKTYFAGRYLKVRLVNCTAKIKPLGKLAQNVCFRQKAIIKDKLNFNKTSFIWLLWKF